jgi:glycosyltransferase involved in cell wall biosynthesis
MIRVLLISHTCQSRTEGQPKAELLAAMPDFDLRVLVPDRWKHYGKWRSADVPAGSSLFQVGQVRLPWTGPGQFYLHYYPELSRLLKDFQPDVVDLWEEPWGLVSVHTCRLRNRLLPKTKIVSETEQNLNRHLPPPFEWFRKYTLSQADFLVGRSRQAVEVACAKGYSGSSMTVPNAVDTQLFRPLDRAECRRLLGWPEDLFIAGYVGRLVERKGITDLLDAAAMCSSEIAVAFVGAGPMAEAIAERGQSSELQHRVLSLAGKPLTELPTVMNALDVMVLPSRTVPTWKEQFGRVIIESHACGVPVIGSDSGAIPEVVEKAGIIFPEGNVGELVRALNLMQHDVARRESMGRIGFQQVMEKYTWQRVAEQMADIYRRCVAAN